MGAITFIRQEGGLGRPLNGKDHYSALLAYFTGTLPAGFTSGDRIKKIFSLADAESLGIKNDFSNETKAATGGTVTVTTPGAAGTVAKISVNGAIIGSYTVITSDTDALVATGLTAAINALTYLTGWSATNLVTAQVLLIPPTGLGAVANTATIAFTSTGTGAAAVVQLSGGVSCEKYHLWYQISEFFRIQPKGVLWVGLYATGTYAGTEIATMQNFAFGEIRQLATIIPHEVIAASHVTATQSVCATLESQERPLSVILGVDFAGKTIATLSDLSTLDSERVSVPLSVDGNWNQTAYDNSKAYKLGEKVSFLTGVYVCKKDSTGGNSPYDSAYWTVVSFNVNVYIGKKIADVGTVLGTVALAKVHENIGWVNSFNIASGNNHDEAGVLTGELYNGLSVSQKAVLDNLRYIYVKKYDGFTGTFFSDSWTATSPTSDYATIENVRTMDKAVRGVRIQETPLINSPLYVKADGTLQDLTIANFKNTASLALEQMEIDGEISSQSVTVDPMQNVLVTSRISIGILIVPVGVAREIQNNIGFTVKTA